MTINKNEQRTIQQDSQHETQLKKIVVIGAGYVGLSNAILLAQTALNTSVTL